ncbi:ROK family protein [Candidatus Chlorohelix allophototropha]|nr:ROK family protein [Chloroflexota bacterium L227-S17]
MHVLGIDIGGTKIAAGVVSSSGELLSFLNQPTPTVHNSEQLYEAIVALANNAIVNAQLTQPIMAVGAGCGGPMLFEKGLFSPFLIPAWRDFPLLARLKESFGMRVQVDNDAKAFALGETLFGAGRGGNCVLGMVVSTGIGGGLVVNGRLFDGANRNGGHIGHTPVFTKGPRCHCGSRGCLTAYASGTALAERARRAIRRGLKSSLSQLPLLEITGARINEAALRGDTLSLKLIRDTAFALARGISSAAVILDLDRVVLGGGLTLMGDLLFEPLIIELERRTRLSFLEKLEVRRAALGEKAGVIGAAALCLQTGVNLD